MKSVLMLNLILKGQNLAFYDHNLYYYMLQVPHPAMFLIQVVTSWNTPANNSCYPCLSSTQRCIIPQARRRKWNWLVMEFSLFTYQFDYMQFLMTEAANYQEY